MAEKKEKAKKFVTQNLLEAEKTQKALGKLPSVSVNHETGVATFTFDATPKKVKEAREAYDKTLEEEALKG